MESFPSKAIRAFDKPVSFSYAPESGSFIIQGSVCNQNVCFIAGPASTAYDESDALRFDSSKMSASLISDIITNPIRLRSYVEKSGTSEINSHIPEYAIYNPEDDPILSDESLGDFVLDNAQFVYPFIG